MNKLIFLLLYVLCSSTSAQVLNSKFDSKNHPKAKGVWVTVRYPTGWQAKEGERPNIVQKFSGDYNGLFVVLSLQIKDAGAPVEQECSTTSAKEWGEALSDKASNTFTKNVKKISHEGKPAFIFEMEQNVERAGLSFPTAHKIMNVCHKNTMIFAWCSPMKVDDAKRTFTSTAAEVNLASPLCFQFFNSLVLMDRY